MNTRQSTAPRIRLHDGRWLGYAEYGDPSGQPLMLFQGTPTARLPHNPLEADLPVRIIVPERPGFGLSDFQPRRRFIDWPADVATLADQLGIERFGALGISGGAPHALACGVALSKRLTAIGIVSGIGPLDAGDGTTAVGKDRRAGFSLARRSALLTQIALWAFRNPRRNAARFMEQQTRRFPRADRALLDDPGLRRLRIDSYAEAARRGLRGFAWELSMLSRPWGFSLADIEHQVHVWHGDEDASVPVGAARQIAAMLPRCTLKVYPGEGHFVAARHWTEILSTLLLPDRRTP